MRNKLARQIGFEVAAIVVGGVLTLAIYRAFEGGAESTRISLQYFWTAGALGVLIYLLLLIRLGKRIIGPLGEIADHAEDMSMGLFQKWEYPEFDSEMDRVAAMMNHVADHNDKLQVSWRTLSFAMAPHMANLRSCGNLPENLRADLEETWDHLRRMDASIMGVFSPSPHFSRPRIISDQGSTEICRETDRSSNRPRGETKQEEPRQIPAGLLMEAVPPIPSGLPETCA